MSWAECYLLALSCGNPSLLLESAGRGRTTVQFLLPILE
jgi:hypothetical protein